MGREQAPPEVSTPADVATLLDEVAPASGVVGAVVGVARGDDVAVATYGFADLDGTAVGSDTRFAIASVTKPMVATVVARLAERRLLDLDSPVAAHVPELSASPWASAATIRHLLANTSGIPLTAAREWLTQGEDDDALARTAASLQDEPAMWRPGRVWSYCNSGWSVLGRVIECVTGTVWEDAMEQELLGPLGLGETEFGLRDAQGPRSLAFESTPAGPKPASPWLSRTLGPAGGSIFSTAGDLIEFGSAHCDDRALAHLRTEHARVDFRWFLDAWCLGWARFDGPGGPVWGWDGIGGGFRAIVRIVPEQRGVVALLANTSSGRDLYRTVFPPVLRGVFGVDLAAPPVAAAGEVPAALGAYEGRFAWSDLDAVVEDVGGALRVTVGGGAPTLGRPVDRRSFVIDAPGADRLTFGFSDFDGDGVPQVFHQLVWGMPRTD